MTKSDKIKQQQSNNLNKIDLKLKDLDSYNNERLFTAVNSNNNLMINKSDFIDNKSLTEKNENILSSNDENELVNYGELVVIGYNGYIPNSREIRTDSRNNNILLNLKENESRHKSKYELRRREKANGVKPAGQRTCSNIKEINDVIKDNGHSITYTLSRDEAVVVKYKQDENTDMFQIGRSSESSIDFIVLDTIPPMEDSNSKNSKDAKQSTISRFSCRIIVEREPPYTARIYAAGFDGSKHIFLGEKATKWKNEKGELDGITTNGILIMHPTGNSSFSSESKCGDWIEVSVCGAIFRLNNTKLIPMTNISNQIHHGNELKDGTLIDLCGATLLWRSAEGLKRTNTLDFIEMYIETLENNKIICPINYLTLIMRPVLTSSFDIEKKFQNLSMWRSRIPMVSTNCGHVQGTHDWGIKSNTTDRECALCRTVGPYVKLQIGVESSFYCDTLGDSFKAYAFNPCGHMATETTCKYWGNIRVPQGTTSEICSVCPFCATPLNRNKPCIKLIFEAGTN